MYQGVTADDAPDIIQGVQANEPVERLRQNDLRQVQDNGAVLQVS